MFNIIKTPRNYFTRELLHDSNVAFHCVSHRRPYWEVSCSVEVFCRPSTAPVYTPASKPPIIVKTYVSVMDGFLKNYVSVAVSDILTLFKRNLPQYCTVPVEIIYYFASTLIAISVSQVSVIMSRM